MKLNKTLKEYDEAIKDGDWSVNEVRDRYGMPPIEGGDVRGVMTPTGFVPIDRLAVFLEKKPKGDDDEATD